MKYQAAFYAFLLVLIAWLLFGCDSPTGPVDPVCTNTLPNPETGKDSAYVVPCYSATVRGEGK